MDSTKASAADDVASLSCGRIGRGRKPLTATFVSEPDTYDVILGRGRAHEHHAGNKHYQGK